MANLLGTLITGNLRTTQGYGTSDSTRILYPGGGSFVTTTSVITGAIRIKMPVFGSGMMMTCTVKVYEYSTNKSFTITFGGHRDSANWYNEFCYIDGGTTRTNLTVRFGIDDGVNCVWIGETSSSWSYPQVFVTDAQLGYVGYSTSWLSGWAVDFVTAFGSVARTQVAYAKITGANIGSQSVSFATTSDTFSTGRTNYKGVTENAVSGQLMWKNYGNNHTIFDASNSTSPTGSAVNNTNSDVAWTGTYPTLMGWNGNSTYGVRVDSARLADTAGALTSMNISQFTNNSGYLTSGLSTSGDSEQEVGARYLSLNSGAARMNIDPRWNESGYDGDLGTLHIWAWRANGTPYGRAGIALYNDGAYQYLTTRSGTTGLFVNNNEIIHAGNIGSQSVTYATSAGSLTSMNISQFTNNSGYITSSASISGNAASATFARRIAGPERIGFNVGGDASTFYPIAISTGAWSTESQYSEFVIERGGYEDPGYTGIAFSTFNARFTYKPSGWGYGAVYFNLEQLTQTATMLGDYLDQYQSSQAIIWLRGATRYNIYSVYGGIGLIFTNEGGTSYTMAYGTYDPISTPREKATTAKYYDSTVRYAGTIYTGSNAVIHAGNIGSQSVTYATTAGSLTSMNISQFTNNSGYLTTESDTLATVTGRGASTSTAISLSGNLTMSGAGASTSIIFGDSSKRINVESYWMMFKGHENEGFRWQTAGQDSVTYTTRMQLTSSALTVSGTIAASNFSGSSSGTNTGDQTNISGNAATATNATAASNLSLTGLGTGSVNVSNGSSAVYRNENGSGGNLSYAPVLHLGASDTMWQIQGDYYDSSTLRWRAGYSGTWYAWRDIIHSGNIASQSVASATDASTLGGYGRGNTTNKIAYFDSVRNLYVNNPESYTGEVRLGAAWGRGGVYAASTLSLSTSGTETHFVFNNSVPIIAYSTGQIDLAGSSTTPINITGASQKYLTINPGNGYEAMVRYIGGTGSGWYVGKRTASQVVGTESFHFYSEAASQTVGGINPSGDMIVTGSMRAPIFYDSQDTAYYVDPNNTSRLVQLNLGTTNTQIKSIDGVGYLRIYGSASNYLGVGPYDNNGWVYFENSGNASGIYFNSPGRYAFDSVDVTPYTDNENSLGSGSYRWANIYTGGWLRNYGAQGMYNESYGTHFYSNGATSWAITGSGGNVELQFRSNHQSTLRGYVYADTSNQIGFLSEDGNWVLKTWNRGVEAYGSMRAPIFYDSANTAYYGDFAGISSMYGLAIRGDQNSTSGENQIFFWGGGNTTTSAIGFKAVAGVWAEHGYTSAGYNTYFSMDSANRGWVFRRATVGGDDWTGVNVASISNTGNAQFDGYVNTPAGYVSNGNPWGTANSAFFPNGITTAGSSNWIYGTTTYIGNAPSNGAGHEFSSSGTQYSTGSITTPLFLVNGHSDNTKGYRIHNTSGTSVSAMFTNSSNQLVIAAGAVDQINLNKKVYVNGVALGVNFAPSATAGRIDASNDIVAFNSSDERLKENITPIANALDKVKSLTGVEFDWKPEHKEAHGHEGRDTGIIAQQVLAVMPTAVRTNDTGYLAVRYEKLIGLLIEANKELAARVEELEKKLG
jgi:hypothetical protein